MMHTIELRAMAGRLKASTQQTRKRPASWSPGTHRGGRRSVGSRPPVALADGTESDTGRSQTRLTPAEMTKEVTARELEQLWVRASDSAEIEALEAWQDAGPKEVWVLEGRLRKEEASHR